MCVPRRLAGDWWATLLTVPVLDQVCKPRLPADRTVAPFRAALCAPFTSAQSRELWDESAVWGWPHGACVTTHTDQLLLRRRPRQRQERGIEKTKCLRQCVWSAAATPTCGVDELQSLGCPILVIIFGDFYTKGAFSNNRALGFQCSFREKKFIKSMLIRKEYTNANTVSSLYAHIRLRLIRNALKHPSFWLVWATCVFMIALRDTGLSTVLRRYDYLLVAIQWSTIKGTCANILNCWPCINLKIGRKVR